MITNKIKIIAGIIIVVISLLVWQNHNNNKYQQLKGEYDVLKEQYEAKKDGAAVAETNRVKEKDSLIGENKILEDFKEKSNVKIASLEKKIKDREAQGTKNKEKIKNLSLIQVAQEIDNIYKVNQATATKTSVNLEGDLSKRVLQTVYEAEECQDVVADKDSIIVEQKTIIVNSEKEVVNVGAMLDSAEKQIKQQKELQELVDKNINNLEKQNKKLRTKSTVGKVLTGIGIIVGIILGAQL